MTLLDEVARHGVVVVEVVMVVVLLVVMVRWRDYGMVVVAR